MWPSVKYLEEVRGHAIHAPIFLAFSIMAKMRANKTDLEFPAPSLGLIHDDQCSYFLLEDVLQCEKLIPNI